MLPTREQEEDLVFGYIRENYLYNIPIALIKLIFAFYNEIFWWIFAEDELNKLTLITNGQFLLSKKFNIKHIQFQCKLYPKGTNGSKNRGWVGLYILPSFIPENISDIIAHYKLYCKETNTFYSITTGVQNNAMIGWGIQTLSWIDCNHCIDKKELNFMCHVDILQIKYKDDKLPLYRKIGTMMKSKIEYEWNIDKKTLFAIKWHQAGYHKKYNGPYFDNDNWTLMCYPNQFKLNTFELGVILCQLPYKINSIQVKGVMFMMYNIHKIKEHKTCLVSYKRPYLQFKMDHYKNYFTMDITKLSFKVQLEIVGVLDLSDNEILKDKWSEYGISS